MMAQIDKFLGRLTMYRLILLWLAALVVAGMVFGLTGLLPYSALDILVSTAFLLAVSFASNLVFSKVFGAATGTDSVYITALLLALIITPTAPFAHLAFLAWAAVLATASKYLLAWRRRHFFNPAAIAVVVTSLFLGQSASWWVGNIPMLPIVVIGGLMVVRQLRRFDLVWTFLMTVMAALLGFAIFTHGNLAATVRELTLHSPLFFFAFAMLTEPLTTPPTRHLQMWYAAVVGFLVQYFLYAVSRAQLGGSLPVRMTEMPWRGSCSCLRSTLAASISARKWPSAWGTSSPGRSVPRPTSCSPSRRGSSSPPTAMSSSSTRIRGSRSLPASTWSGPCPTPGRTAGATADSSRCRRRPRTAK